MHRATVYSVMLGAPKYARSSRFFCRINRLLTNAQSIEVCSECNRSIVWLGSSVVECSHGKREALGSSPGRATFFLRPCDIWWLSVGPCSGCEQQRDCLVGSGMVPSRSGTNLIKQGGNVTGRSCGSVAQ